MKSFIVLRTILSFVFLSLFITACGGGGGGGSSDPYSLSSNSISFDAVAGGSAPASQVVTVTVNSGTVFVDVVESSAYFSTSFTLTGPTTGDITITPTSPTMAPGQYSGSITVYGCSDSFCNAQVAGSPKTIDVTYTVTAINVSPEFINFSLLEGTATDTKPASVDYTGVASGWSASVVPGTGTANWWSLSATSGATLPAQINVTADVTAIPVGVHTATLNFTVNGVTKSVPLTLTVNAQAVNFVSPYVATTSVSGDVIIRGHGFTGLTTPQVMFGATAASAFTIVNDSEIRATHPGLALGNYVVTVEDNGSPLTSNASLVVMDAPVYSYQAIARTGNEVRNIVYDAERQSIYISDATENQLERYVFGTSWSLAEAINLTAFRSGNAGDITMSPDGQTLYRTNSSSFYAIDLDNTASRPLVNVFPFTNSLSYAKATNDGKIIMTSTSVGNYLFAYNSLSGGFEPLSNSFRYANSFLGAPTNGSQVVIPYFALGAASEFVEKYLSSTGELSTTGLVTSNLSGVSLDKTGSRTIIWHTGAINEHRVYDENLSLLGSLPPLDGQSFLNGIAGALSPDGTRAYAYNNSTGLLHVLDTTTSDGAGGFVEIGTATTIADSAGTNPRMVVTPDGGTIIIVGSSNVLVVPAP